MCRYIFRCFSLGSVSVAKGLAHSAYVSMLRIKEQIRVPCSSCDHSSQARKSDCLFLAFIWSSLSLYLIIIIFFYINRRKYWFCEIFRLPVFDGFTRFWDVLSKIWLFLENICLCVCDKNFAASVVRELMHRISWNFISSIILT